MDNPTTPPFEAPDVINLGAPNGVLFPMPLTERQKLGVQEMIDSSGASSLDDIRIVAQGARVISLPSIPRKRKAKAKPAKVEG